MIALGFGNPAGRAVRRGGRLTTPRRFLLAVLSVYVLAWCLPSVRYDIMGTVLMRGWDVTWEALTPFWKAGMKMNQLVGNLLSVSSALTNVVFIVVLIHAWRWTSPDRLSAVAPGERRPFRWGLWALGVSAVVNLYWLILRGLLAEGYFLWLSSFVALAVVLARVRRRATLVPSIRLPA